MSTKSAYRSARLLATTSMVALTLAAVPVTIPTIGDSSFFKAAVAESCCFIGATEVLLADGRSQPIGSIAVGTLVMGRNGRINRVVAVERPRLGQRRLFGFNGGRPFVTAEHPFMTEAGWKSIDPSATAREAPALRVDALQVGDSVLRGRVSMGTATDGATALAPQPQIALYPLLLNAIEGVDAPAETTVFNLVLDGDRSFFADGFLVHNKGGSDDSGSGEGGESNSGSGGGGSSSGEGGSSGSGGESGGSSGGGSSGGGESGESGGSGGGESGESGGSGQSGESGASGQSGESGDPFQYLGGERPDASALQQVGGDLSPEQERELIENGWQ